MTEKEMRALRDELRWRAEREFGLNGATSEFHQLARSYHKVSSEIGYPEDVIA